MKRYLIVTDADGKEAHLLCGGVVTQKYRFLVNAHNGAVVTHRNFENGEEDLRGAILPLWTEAAALCRKKAAEQQRGLTVWSVNADARGVALAGQKSRPSFLRGTYAMAGRYAIWLKEIHPLPEKGTVRYVGKKYRHFLKRYEKTINAQTEDRFVRRLVMSILIAEDHQKPWYLRMGEYAAFLALKCLHKKPSMTLGVAQVRTECMISGKQSVITAVRILGQCRAAHQNLPEDEALARIARDYNHCDDYVNNVVTIYQLIGA